MTAESHRPSSRVMRARVAHKISETALLIRMSKALRRDAEKAAKAEGVKLSEWIRGAMRLRIQSEARRPV